MRKDAILSQVFFARIEAIEALGTAPWPAADGLAILRSAPPAEVTVVTIVVQGNITRPSKLSR
jgi:hypothetical protein